MSDWVNSFRQALDKEDSDTPEERGEFKPLPNGEYTMVLNDVVDEPNPNDNIMSTTLEFEVVEGEHQGRKVWEKIKHTDSLLWKVAKLYRSLQMNGDLESFDDFSRSLKSERGRQFLVTTKNREYNDKTYTNADRIKPANAVMSGPVPF